MIIYTIGHSNVPAAQIVDLLQQHGVQTVFDVRSTPYSRWNPQFNRQTLARTLQAAGINYVFAGDMLGGRPQDETCYRDGQVSYELVAARDWFQTGIDELISAAREIPIVLLCAEADPLHCHRHKLLAPTLIARGVEMWHILKDGSLLAAGLPGEQLPMFGPKSGREFTDNPQDAAT